MEGLTSLASLPQYISSVLSYHVLHGISSQSGSPILQALTRSYGRNTDLTSSARLARVGCSAAMMRRVVLSGMNSAAVSDISSCLMVVFALSFQCRGAMVSQVRPKDVTKAEDGVTVVILHQKGKYVAHPLRLQYIRVAGWSPVNPVALFDKEVRIRRAESVFFDLTSTTSLGSSSLSDAMEHTRALCCHEVPTACHVTAHSPCTGSYNDLRSLGFPKDYIMRKLD